MRLFVYARRSYRSDSFSPRAEGCLRRLLAGALSRSDARIAGVCLIPFPFVSRVLHGDDVVGGGLVCFRNSVWSWTFHQLCYLLSWPCDPLVLGFLIVSVILITLSSSVLLPFYSPAVS